MMRVMTENASTDTVSSVSSPDSSEKSDSQKNSTEATSAMRTVRFEEPEDKNEASTYSAATDVSQPEDKESEENQSESENFGRKPTSCYYKVGRELGIGTYSVVKEAKHIETNEWFAAKVINKKLMRGREHLVKNEVVVLKRISRGHPNILTLVDYFETDNSLYLVTELAKGGELFDRICSRGSLYESDAAQLMKQITSGVAHLHANGIVHRDLKPENLLFKTTSASSNLLICDFGLSRIIDEENFRMLTTTVGTPGYMAPEIFTKKGYGKPVDIWALGVIAYLLLSGFPPFDRDTPAEEREAIEKGEFYFTPEKYWVHVTADAQNFIKACLQLDPAKRPTATECLNSPFLTRKYRNKSEIGPSSSSVTINGTPIPSNLKGPAMNGAYSTSPESEGFSFPAKWR